MVEWSEMTLNYNGEVSKPNRVVGGSIPSCEVVSLLDGKLAMRSSVSCVSKIIKHMVERNILWSSGQFLV